MKKLRLIYLGLGLCLAGCEKDVTPYYEAAVTPKMVMASRLVADSTFRVNLSRTVPLTGHDTLLFINDGEITVSGGGDRRVLVPDGAGNYVSSSGVVAADTTYRIDCSAPGLEPVRAEVCVPGPFPLEGLQMQVDEAYNVHIEIRLTDPPGPDYYALCAESWQEQVHTEYRPDTTLRRMVTIFDKVFMSLDGVVTEYTGGPFWFEEAGSRQPAYGFDFYFSDRGFEGTTQKLHASFSLAQVYNDTLPQVTLHLMRKGPNLFRYIQSLAGYEPEPDLPVLQPQHIYTNVEQGMGLVTAEHRLKRSFPLDSWFDDPAFQQHLDSLGAMP